MEIDFGQVKTYDIKGGFGYLGRTFQKRRRRDTWFHIKSVKKNYLKLAKKMDSGFYSDVSFWYEYEIDKINGKQTAIRIWLNSQDIPKEVKDTLVKYIEGVWSQAILSYPQWLDKITIDLVGQKRRDELFEYSHSLEGITDVMFGPSTTPPTNKTKHDDRKEYRKPVESLFSPSTTYLSRNIKRGNEEVKLKKTRKHEIERIEKHYGLTRDKANELYQLLEETRSLNFTYSKELSAYIVDNRLGDKYKHISGVLIMHGEDKEWPFEGGFPPRIYAIVCKELNLCNQRTSARPGKFTPYKDII